MPLPKPCKVCGVRFQPTGKTSKLCVRCCKVAQEVGRKKRELTFQLRLQ